MSAGCPPARHMSQFHFGSIQTSYTEVYEWLKGEIVSIPLWFNSNRKEKTMATQQNFSLNSTLVQFKLEIRVDGDFNVVAKSQFHFGSIQTHGLLSQKTGKATTSQFHFGSIQTEIREICDTKGRRIGLNSTLVQFKPKESILEYIKFIKVSIPLWFNSNFNARGLSKEKINCLNSTLVQFKPLRGRSNWTVYPPSQFHFGSIQT